MTQRLSSKRNKVHRLFTKDRRRGYVTPSEQDVQCPHFDKKWVRLGDAPIVNDMVAICHNPRADCDYLEDFGEDMALCSRYYRYHPTDFTLDTSPPTDFEGNWQEADGNFIFERPFDRRSAEVELIMTQDIADPVDMGDFMNQWVQFDETPSSKGDWYQNAANELYNNINQTGGRSAWYNPEHRHEEDYRFSMRVQARASDNDIYGCIFRYSPSTHAYYSLEWDSNGMDIQGVAIVKNIPTNPHMYGIDYLDYENYLIQTRESTFHSSANHRSDAILAHAPIPWGTGQSYIHDIIVTLRGNRIIVELYRVTNGVRNHLHTFDVVDDDRPLLRGAWGPMTWSQPSTYFWIMQMEKYNLIDSSVHEGLRREIQLERQDIKDGHRVISEPIGTYFASYIDAALARIGLSREDITTMEYVMHSHNVPESINFIQYDTHKTITTYPNTTLGLDLSEDDYGHTIRYPFSLIVPDDTIPMYEVYHTVTKDMKFIGVEGDLLRLNMIDMYMIRAASQQVHIVPNVYQKFIRVHFEQQELNMNPGETVRLQYYPNYTPVEYYVSPYAVDTHNRVYMIKNRKHGWHKWNPYAPYLEEDEDERI